jgi:hypothetical protein
MDQQHQVKNVSTSIKTFTLDASNSSRRPSLFSGWLREPLLHFILLGGLLFVADHLLIKPEDDPSLIVVGTEVNIEAEHIFEETRGRKPNDQELQALHRIWLDNEVLYREGLALQLDKGDEAIRERVIFKALSVIDAGLKLPHIDEKELRAWFESRRDKYDDPARYTFQEAVLAGTNDEVAIRKFVTELNAGAPADAEAGLRVFRDRPLSNLVQSYGAEFPQSLDAMPPGEWRALQTQGGWRAIRLDTITAPKPAVFEQLSGVILQDWKDAKAAELRTAAVRALAKKYTVEFETRDHSGH